MNLYAPVSSTEFPELDGVVLFELRDTEEKSFILEIRYRSFKSQEVEGDHAYVDDLEAVKKAAESTYGIHPGDWRELTLEEALLVGGAIK